MVGTKKIALPEAGKSTKKPAIKKVCQQKKAAPLTEEIEKEIVRVADGFFEKGSTYKSET